MDYWAGCDGFGLGIFWDRVMFGWWGYCGDLDVVPDLRWSFGFGVWGLGFDACGRI